MNARACAIGNGDAQATLDATQAAQHPDCILCGTRNAFGLGLRFQAHAPGNVRAEFIGHALLQSYPDTLHGGVTAALLDAAMTNCLFSLGIVAVTAEMTVRYVSPINLHDRIELAASREAYHPPLHYLIAELRQNEKLVAKARAKFFEKGMGSDEHEGAFAGPP